MKLKHVYVRAVKIIFGLDWNTPTEDVLIGKRWKAQKSVLIERSFKLRGGTTSMIINYLHKRFIQDGLYKATADIETQAQFLTKTRKMDSQMGIEPATFWSPVKHFNHLAVRVKHACTNKNCTRRKLSRAAAIRILEA